MSSLSHVSLAKLYTVLNQVLRRVITEIEEIYLLSNLQFNKAAICKKCNISIGAYISNIGYKTSFFFEKLLRTFNTFKRTEKGG